jgi:hypothetical protein
VKSVSKMAKYNIKNKRNKKQTIYFLGRVTLDLNQKGTANQTSSSREALTCPALNREQ